MALLCLPCSFACPLAHDAHIHDQPAVGASFPFWHCIALGGAFHLEKTSSFCKSKSSLCTCQGCMNRQSLGKNMPEDDVRDVLHFVRLLMPVPANMAGPDFQFHATKVGIRLESHSCQNILQSFHV